VQLTTPILWFIGILWFLAFNAFSLVSLAEGVKRSAKISILTALIGLAVFISVTLFSASTEIITLFVIMIFTVFFVIVFALPIGQVDVGDDVPKKRIDERDIMFARARLKPGSPEYESYYKMRPENLMIDDRTRAKPGLLSLDAKLADPFMFAATDGSFFFTDSLREAVDGAVSELVHPLSSESMTRYLKNLAQFYGALDVGVAELKPYHVYSHIGRGSGRYGATLTVKHRFAIAFTVEMDYRMTTTSPNPPLTMETGRQYVEAARIAVQLAAAIRNLGYPARAHIDGNYRVIAPLVTRDAGLGEIGRMGLLMTPNLGPRVRLGVVTTDADLIPDGRNLNPTVIDFCNICKKCAVNCPSKSISFDERRAIDGALRWQIDSNTCFHYWNVIGTDCGRCMAVCPYSHPDNLVHNMVRWGINRSGAFRRLALWADDLFYGVHPYSHSSPEWTKPQKV
jgi:ferredoxin